MRSVVRSVGRRVCSRMSPMCAPVAQELCQRRFYTLKRSGDLPEILAGEPWKCPAVGQVLEAQREFTKENTAQFTELTGDSNVLHTTSIVPGHFVASMIPGLIGSHICGAVYLSQTIKYTAPVRFGDTVTTRITVKSVSAKLHAVVFIEPV